MSLKIRLEKIISAVAITSQTALYKAIKMQKLSAIQPVQIMEAGVELGPINPLPRHQNLSVGAWNVQHHKQHLIKPKLIFRLKIDVIPQGLLKDFLNSSVN